VDGYLLQDWTTLRATSAQTTVVQSEVGWLDLEGYRDVVLWLEVRHVANGGGTNVVLDYQTSPEPDESYFTTMESETLTASADPVVQPIPATATTPLEVWLRWRLRVTGSPSSDWGATFRIHCAANPSKAVP
jgi:hypothetical protein